MKLVVNSPDELVAAIPHVLGFTPSDSAVVVPLSKELPVARLDLPTSARDVDDFLDALTGPYARHATTGSAVAVVCFTEDAALAEAVSEQLAQRFQFVGVATKLRLAAGSERWQDLDVGTGGPVTAQAALRVASEAVVAGVAAPVATRSELGASLVGDRTPVAACLSSARIDAAASTPTAERSWATDRCQQFENDGIRLSDSDSARMLLAMQATSTRDALWEAATVDNASAHTALWSDLVRRAPDEVRAAPAALCGFASWLNGDGARAWCALDQIPAGNPYPLAAVVATVLQEGLSPREWADVRTFMTELITELDESFVPEPSHAASERHRLEPEQHRGRPGPGR